MDNQPAFENPDKKSLKRLRTISAIERETATSANLNEAIERLETIKDKYLDSAYFQVILANLYLDTGKTAQAFDSAMLGLKLSTEEPESEGPALSVLVIIVEKDPTLVDIDSAIRQTEEVTLRHPKSIVAWRTLGRIYLFPGKFKKAEIALKTALDLDPSNPSIHYDLGGIYALACYHNKNPRLSRGSSVERLRQIITEPQLLELKVTDPKLYQAVTDGKEHRDKLTGLTLEALGYTYQVARHLAEMHTKEVIRFSAPGDSLNVSAREQLNTLSITDKM